MYQLRQWLGGIVAEHGNRSELRLRLIMNLIHVIHRHERLRIDFHHEIHQSTELMLRHDRDDLRVLLEIIGPTAS